MSSINLDVQDFKMYNFDVIIKNANMFSIMIPQNATQPGASISSQRPAEKRLPNKTTDGSRADKMATRPPRNVSFIIIIRGILRECSLLIECLPAEKDLFSNDHYKISCNSPPPLVLLPPFRDCQGDYPCETSGRELDCSWVLGTCYREGDFEGGSKHAKKGPQEHPTLAKIKQ